MKKIVFAGIVALLAIACAEKPEKKPMYTLFVGTYTDGDSEGIYTYTFDANTGELSNQKLAAKLTNPSYLTISDNKKNLYAVQETADFDSLGGGVTAFSLNKDVLELQNSMGTQGAHPCHVSLSGDGHLVVANYTGGNVSIFSLNDDGSLTENPQVIDHKPLDSVKTSHAHMAQFNADGLMVTDLGLDAVKRYNKKGDEFVPAEQNSLPFEDGAGPRHFTFGNNGQLLYVINELNSTISVFEKAGNGNYQEVQVISTLNAGFDGESFCADIHLSPDGKFLYGSNRGENTIVIFEVDEDSGQLELVGRESVHGDWPRNFSMDPTGEFLLVANKKTSNIAIFKRHAENGTLTFLNEVKHPDPVCLVFLD
ncbi:6-phosphogluconolactonase [Allomuricauda ruestringensis DSM 13258]|uniref:6-phosphogluconolactonase n=1 Tax=Allomuricauda ruestringensis (strain DSM 13258 / CIP 107369 / LMG 19739 / B1) TaxID=886377 RepID=G2PQE4_ALLRU|nr:lactonase family protein [Allomuricauda ruestringensis]AEM70539.1 6-phosphogluconolactonase [Allomuricauda ruestringensis DSM 13258]